MHTEINKAITPEIFCALGTSFSTHGAGKLLVVPTNVGYQHMELTRVLCNLLFKIVHAKPDVHVLKIAKFSTCN